MRLTMGDGWTRLVTVEELRLRGRMAVALAELDCRDNEPEVHVAEAAKILRTALLAEKSVKPTGYGVTLSDYLSAIRSVGKDWVMERHAERTKDGWKISQQ